MTWFQSALWALAALGGFALGFLATTALQKIHTRFPMAVELLAIVCLVLTVLTITTVMIHEWSWS
jgi:hypothetical protein